MAESAAAAAAEVKARTAGKPRAPNEQEHKDKVEVLNKSIADLEAELATLRTPKDEAEKKEATKPRTPAQVKRDELFGQLKPLKVHKDVLIKDKQALNEQVEQLNSTITKLQAGLPGRGAAGSKDGESRFRTSEEIDKQVAKMEQELSMQHHKLSDEKKIVADINILKRSKKTLAEQATARELIKTSRDQMRVLRDKISELQGKITALRTEEDALKTELTSLKEVGQSEGLKRAERRKEIKTQLDEAYNSRREEINTFRSEKNAHWEATKVERDALRLKRQEEKRAHEEAQRAIYEARMKEWDEYEASRHPWEDEMRTCELLKEYLAPLSPETSTAVGSSQPDPHVSLTDLTGQGEGTLLLSKKDRDADLFFVGGGGKKAAGKKGKKTARAKPLKLDRKVFEQFLSIGLQPPTNTADIPAMLDTLTAKKDEYNQKPRPEKNASAAVRKRKQQAAEGEDDLVAEAETSEPEFEAIVETESEATMEPESTQTAGDNEDNEELPVANDQDGAAAESESDQAHPALDVDANADADLGGPSGARGSLEAVPTPPAHLRTYDNDSALGKPVPDMSSLVYVKGDALALGQGVPAIILFWAQFAEGDYSTVVSVSDLHDTYGLASLGISCDPEQTAVEKFVGRLGQALPEINIAELRANFALAFDPEKKVKTAFVKTCGLSSLGASAVFLVDGAGTIVWREQFSQGHTVDKGQLAEQIRRLLAGQELLENGDKPVYTCEDDDDEECAMGEPDDDGLLF